MSKKAPPGFEPHKIVHRVDGWITDPENENHIPIAVARLIAEAVPPLGGGNAIERIRARMLARQHEYERRRKLCTAPQRMLERVKKADHE